MAERSLGDNFDEYLLLVILDVIILVAIMANLACVFCDKKAPSKPVELHACVYEYVFVPTFEKENAKKGTFVRPSSSS